ncbi:MAG: phenylacetate--CoA ligase, partial [Halieaceae bacterium]
MASSLSSLQAVQQLSADALASLQLERLRQTLAHVYSNSPVYRAKFDAAGVSPEDLTDLADLSKFPFTVKDDLREHYPFGLFSVPMDQVVRVHASSGTTGKPTVVGYTQGDIDRWATCVARSIEAA